MKYNSKKNRGDVAIYIVLLVMTIMLAGAVVMSGLLARQFRLGRSIVVNERSFYAANSGLEHILFELSKKTPPVPVSNSTPLTAEIQYDDSAPAIYKSYGQVLPSGSVCAYSSSEYQNNLGRLRSLAGGCPLE